MYQPQGDYPGDLRWYYREWKAGKLEGQPIVWEAVEKGRRQLRQQYVFTTLAVLAYLYVLIKYWGN